MNDEPTYLPGDIVNGHVLGADRQWHPLNPAPPAPDPVAIRNATAAAAGSLVSLIGAVILFGLFVGFLLLIL